jgi:hypothetical protein
LYLATRYYPALLLLYSGGIGAVAGQQYENLRDLMLSPVRLYNESADVRPILIRPVTEQMLELERIEAFKQLPGLERRYAPKSDYLYDLLRPLLDDLLLLGSEYDAAFDRFEVLYALEYCNQYERNDPYRFWGPIGRFGWKRQVLQDVVKEAETAGATWAPLQAGLCNGSFERFKVLAEALSGLIRNVNWS